MNSTHSTLNTILLIHIFYKCLKKMKPYPILQPDNQTQLSEILSSIHHFPRISELYAHHFYLSLTASAYFPQFYHTTSPLCPRYIIFITHNQLFSSFFSTTSDRVLSAANTSYPFWTIYTISSHRRCLIVFHCTFRSIIINPPFICL
jgi:hypothetical protein